MPPELLTDFTDNDLYAVRNHAGEGELGRDYPFWPLTAPDMPAPGPTFNKSAQAMTSSVVEMSQAMYELHFRALYDHSGFYTTATLKGRDLPVRYVPGHWLGDPVPRGPRDIPDTECRVMIIGKMPGDQEQTENRNFVGPSGQLLLDALRQNGFEDNELANWYVTNVCRFKNPDPSGGALKATWLKDCRPLLEQEMRIVRPHIIFCLGREALQTVLGKQYTMQSMIGRMETLSIDMRREPDDTATPWEAKVLAAIHPAAVARSPEQMPQLQAAIESLEGLVHRNEFATGEDDIDHRVIRDRETLDALVNEIIAETKGKGEKLVLAADAEWHGEYPTQPGAYLRTIQISWKPRKAACIVIYEKDGVPEFKSGGNVLVAGAIEPLQRLFDETDVIAGHFFNADLPWIAEYGVDLRERFHPAETPETMRDSGGFDTGLAAHAHCETMNSYELETLATRYTGCPRYDTEINDWIRLYLKENGLKKDDLGGYGAVPSEILHPYGNYDADATRRLYDVYAKEGGLLDADQFGQSSWVPFHTTMRAQPAFLEMNETGIRLDAQRVADMTRIFEAGRDQLLAELRSDIGWESFNPGSPDQVCSLLFGEEALGKLDSEGNLKQVLPEHVQRQNLPPVKTTSGKPWERVVRDGQTHLFQPSTDAETLGILSDISPLASKMRDHRFISKVTSSVLKAPDKDEEGRVLGYPGGMMKYICHDERIRSSFFQTLDTGRASSARPPLQNLGKQREADYRRILGDLYQFPIRSMLCAAPGHVLIEADYTGAELAIIAWMSQDATMIDHVRRNSLPEDHPDFFDIHSNTCVTAFRLDCDPTKRGLKSIGKAHLRIAAKAVIFGLSYGRGAEAIAREVRENGVEITVEQAQGIIDTILGIYPGMASFMAQCQAAVLDPGHMTNCFGRRRRFGSSEDNSVVAGMQRQAMNFPAQSAVADAVSKALHNLLEFRRTCPYPDPFKIVLQIHDAIILEVPIRYAVWVAETVFPQCMGDVPVWPSDLRGNRLPLDQPYHLGIDVEVSERFSGGMSESRCAALGLPARLAS